MERKPWAAPQGASETTSVRVGDHAALLQRISSSMPAVWQRPLDDIAAASRVATASASPAHHLRSLRNDVVHVDAVCCFRAALLRRRASLAHALLCVGA
jgi:hypothetical protein